MAWSQLFTAAVNIGLGESEKISGENQKRKAQAFKPPLEDPEMRSYLGYLDRKRRAIETGGAYGNLYNQVGRNLANTQSGIIQASGGNAGAAILGMTRAQGGANQAISNITQQQMSDLNTWDTKFGNVLGDIAQRKQDLQLFKYNQEMAEAAAKIKSGDEQVKGATQEGIGGISGIIGMIGKKDGDTSGI